MSKWENIYLLLHLDAEIFLMDVTVIDRYLQLLRAVTTHLFIECLFHCAQCSTDRLCSI